MIALPTITRGCRARVERLVGTSTLSGSSTARGLRGVIRPVSGIFGVIGAGPFALGARADNGGYGSPAPCTALSDALGAGRASGRGARARENSGGGGSGGGRDGDGDGRNAPGAGRRVARGAGFELGAHWRMVEEAKEPPPVPLVRRSGPPERGTGAFRHLGSVGAAPRDRVG